MPRAFGGPMAVPKDPLADEPSESGSLTGLQLAGGRFLVRGLLGAGGMGEVYLAEDTRLKRPVALKRIARHLRADRLARERFYKEAERASKIEDPHVALLYDLFEDQDDAYLVMEYVEGVTFRRLGEKPLPIPEFLDLAVDSAQGLVAAHSRGVLHCDIKPENIMRTPNGQVKFLDFGIARLFALPDDPTRSPSLDRAPGGTLAYMAPEMLLGGKPDRRTDIYSLGVVFYEL